MVPAGERRDQRDTWHGFSNALSHAFELVATTVIFVLIGLWIDGRFGTRPLFTVVLGLLAVIGLGVRAYYTYMDQIAPRRGGEAVAEQEPVVPLVEREVALDIVRRGLMVSPLVIVLVAGLIRGWDGAASAAIALGIVLVNFLAAAAIMTRAAKSGPTAIGAAALGGYVAPPRRDPRRTRIVAPPTLDRSADARHRHRRHPSRVARLGNEIRESHARCAGVEAGTTFRRPMNLLLAVDVPPISNVTIWGSGPLGFNKTAAIYVFAAVATMLALLLRHAPQGRARALGHPAEHGRVGRRASSATRSSCRRWAPTACGTCRT